jgi:hypothetical protein
LGVVAAAKAVVHSLRSYGKQPKPVPYYDEEEPFV